MNALSFRNFTLDLGGRRILQSVNLVLGPGQILALVGESGAGKTMLLRAAMGDLPQGARVQGALTLAGREMLQAQDADWRQVRGKSVAPVFQTASDGLSPVRRVGQQILDALEAGGRGVHDLAPLIASLELDPKVLDLWAHELSGGMAQRVAVARAIATGAQVILADEPTSALDGPSARAVLRALAQARAMGRSVLLVTHDPALAAEVADRMAVLVEGQLVEQGAAQQVMERPEHPFTASMIATLTSRLPAYPKADLNAGSPILQLNGLGMQHRTGLEISIDALALIRGEVLALCGRSGSGKTTITRLIAKVEQPDFGRMTWKGVDIASIPPAKFAKDPRRLLIQMVPQDARSSFPPHETLLQSMRPSLLRFDVPKAALIAQCRHVGFDPDLLAMRPSQLSNGQLARAALARALALQPELLILDEPTAALDAPRQAEIIGALARQRGQGQAMILSTHDLHLARLISDRIAVIHAGRIVEIGPTHQLLTSPQTPAAKALISAMI